MAGSVQARRVLLATGMFDELPGIEGFGSLWGKSIFICPYCDAWEVQDRRFAYLATNLAKLDFALLLRAWTSDVIVLTSGRVAIPEGARARLEAGGVVIHSIAPENVASQRVAVKLGSTNLGPGKLPPPFEHDPVDLWGQTREEWVGRRPTR